MSSHLENEINWNELQRVLRMQMKPYGSSANGKHSSFEHHKRRLVEIVKRTSLMGESNSALIIGPRGSGKSALLQLIIEELFSIKAVKGNLLPVILNGLVHTDDNIALKDIVKQLDLESISEKTIGSFSEKLNFLLEALKTGSKQNKSILFVLDEFDLFCGHKDQTLLYNLFDVAQSQQSPICVIGLSCRPDILSKLENRVRSRFSHQLLYLFESIKFSDYVAIAKEALSLPRNFSDPKFQVHWNADVDAVLDSLTVQEVLRKCYYLSYSIRDLKRYLFHIVAKISAMHPKLEAGDFIDAFTFHSKDAKAVMLQGLSILEISLVIAMMHLTELYGGEPFNFEMVYYEYKKFLEKKMSFRSLNKAVVLKTFEHLLSIGLVKEVLNANANTLRRFAPVRMLLHKDQITEALNRYPNLPFQLLQWSSSSITD